MANQPGWLDFKHISQFFGQHGETGIDIPLPRGTPITSPFSGKVIGSGYYAGGGVVTIRTKIGGKWYDFYVQHLDQAFAKVGEMIKKGQVIGTSGGQLRGGHHPSDRFHSTAPHVEVGFNAPGGGIWGSHHPGPNFNPLPFLARLFAQRGVVAGTLSTQAMPVHRKGSMPLPGINSSLGIPGHAPAHRAAPSIKQGAHPR